LSTSLGAAYGLHIMIRTNGVCQLYAHLSQALVSPGQKVRQGERIDRVRNVTVHGVGCGTRA